MVRRKLLRVIAGSCGAVGILVLAVAGEIYAYGGRDETVKADAAIVLGAAVWTDRPSPVFRERILHGVALYHRGMAPRLIFTGGRGAPREAAESIIARQFAIDRGVPAEAILIETVSHTTEENLRYAGDVARRNGIRRVLIVSDPLHMKRSMRMARDLGLEAFASPTPTSRYRGASSQLRFLARETWFYLRYVLRQGWVTPAEVNGGGPVVRESGHHGQRTIEGNGEGSGDGSSVDRPATRAGSTSTQGVAVPVPAGTPAAAASAD